MFKLVLLLAIVSVTLASIQENSAICLSSDNYYGQAATKDCCAATQGSPVKASTMMPSTAVAILEVGTRHQVQIPANTNCKQHTHRWCLYYNPAPIGSKDCPILSANRS